MGVLQARKNLRQQQEEEHRNQQALLEDYYQTLLQLRQLRARFEEVSDPELVSACIYEMEAVQQRYAFLLKRIREEKLTSLRVLRCGNRKTHAE